VYGTARTLPITEDHPLQGQSPYSASKIAADKLAEAYALSFQLPVTVLRPFNTYGPRQSARAVIPTIIGQLLAAPESLQLGSLTPKRDLTFVTDTAAGFLRMLDADLVAGTTIHLGTGSMISIGDLVGVCQEILDTHVPIVEEQRRVRPEGSEVMALQSDPALAHSLLNWQPTVSLRAGLAATIDWLRERPVSSNPAAYQT
jgi:nucleoside-diphosphate-sugar epimerase